MRRKPRKRGDLPPFLILADGRELDFDQAQRYSAEFALAVTGWRERRGGFRDPRRLWAGLKPGPSPTQAEVLATIEACFPAARLVRRPRPEAPA